MITVFVGQRGTGKSSLLRRVESYYKQRGIACQCYDLDSEIERKTGLSIHALFAQNGEAAFRQQELSTFEELLKKSQFESRVFVALGAGFSGQLPPQVRVIWVRRASDSLGRVFLDRPRLAPGSAPLEEYWQRATQREAGFEARADEILTLSDGFDRPNAEERAVLLGEIQGLRGCVTLLASHLSEQKLPRAFVQSLVRYGLRIEIRDDLIEKATFDRVLESLSGAKLLFAVRTKDSYLRVRHQELKNRYPSALWDWPLELGPCAFAAEVVSLHERYPNESVRAAGERLEIAAMPDAILKLAVEVSSLQELAQGHRWAAECPCRRAFLPRSPNGRWAWYRLLSSQRSPLGFVRCDNGSSPDQPTLLEWLGMGKDAGHFAAILGKPVLYSRTPAEQSAYFGSLGWPVFRIELAEEEFDQAALALLYEFGLRAAAVTSPLKLRAYKLCGQLSESASRLQSVNTLVWEKASKRWAGHNTDLDGAMAFRKLVFDAEKVVIWGGGGTLPVLQQCFPQAKHFSARCGGEADALPEVVLWAVPRGRSVKWPPPSWRPRIVLDLNYSEDSPGREYALYSGAEYRDGLGFFERQALAQRSFWERYVRQ